MFWIANSFDLDRMVKAYLNSEEPLASLYLQFIEDVVKDLARALATNPKAEKVVFTGRHSRINYIVKHISEYIGNHVVQRLSGLKGASLSKEAGQGYAAIGAGIVGEHFDDVVNHMGIRDACGTVVDYVLHPAAKGFRDRVRRAYVETVRNPKLCRETQPLQLLV